MCCDTAQALVFLLVSVCCDTAQALVFLLVSVCCDTAQIKEGSTVLNILLLYMGVRARVCVCAFVCVHSCVRVTMYVCAYVCVCLRARARACLRV